MFILSQNCYQHFKTLRKHKSEKEIKRTRKMSKEFGSRGKIVRSEWDILRNREDHENILRFKQKGLER